MANSKNDILRRAQTVAIMGCSADEYRTSYHIAKYLQQNGYRIIPVNPNYDEILGEKVYDTLQDIPTEITIDVADIFRNKKHTADMVRQIIERVKSSGKEIAIWTQLDVSSTEAKKLAKAADLLYVENECMMVEHERLAD